MERMPVGGTGRVSGCDGRVSVRGKERVILGKHGCGTVHGRLYLAIFQLSVCRSASSGF